MKKREVWLDVLRILAAFLVIVNHTNSDVFQSVTPENGTWWLSIAWYALCKIAVPVFIMVSGSVLLGRVDDHHRWSVRIQRIFFALLFFSYLYFLHDAWVHYGLWPRALRLDLFMFEVWEMSIADSSWYLYFYLGLMILLPLLQRLSCALTEQKAGWITGIVLGLGAGWPTLVHFVPSLASPVVSLLTKACTMLGLFFAGWQLRKARKPLHTLPWLMVLIASVLLSVSLLRAEYLRLEGAGKYWAFMDDRLQPSLSVVVSAFSLFLFIRSLFDRPMHDKALRLWTELGGCAFGVYLLQHWVIDQSEFRLFIPLCNVLPAFPAVIVWEVIVFGICLIVAMIMRRIPLLKKIV